MDILTSARPEDVGVRPQWVAGYVREMNRRRKMCHSFLMMRRGKVFAEGYWKPFGQQELRQRGHRAAGGRRDAAPDGPDCGLLSGVPAGGA